MEKVFKELEKWIGYLEKKSNKDLEHKTKNAGNKNYTIFAKLYKDYTGANLQAQAWCAMLISVCFVLAYGLEIAKKLLCGQLYSYCPYGMAAFRKKGQLHSKPKSGDIVFFIRNGVARHTGFVYKVNGNYIYTIEGNTSGASGVIANGGGVCKKSYAINENMKFGRPDYSLVEEIENKTTTKQQKAETDTKTETSKLTKAKLIKALQIEINVTCDGIVGKETLSTLPTLKNGSKGFCVKMLQRALSELHNITVTGGTDGIFGAGTEKAVKDFQKKNGLKIDGIVGKNTWKALLD